MFDNVIDVMKSRLKLSEADVSRHFWISLGYVLGVITTLIAMRL
jgi:hypothetical protein